MSVLMAPGGARLSATAAAASAATEPWAVVFTQREQVLAIASMSEASGGS